MPLPSYAQECREHGFFSVLHPDRDSSCPLATLGALRVTGADASSFLHSQLTNEVKALKPGEGNLSARVTRTGTLVRYFSLHRLPEETPAFLLILEAEGIRSLLADLGKFAVIEDVALDDVSSEYNWLTLQGSTVAQVGDSVFGRARLPGSESSESWNDLPEYAVRYFEHGPPAGSLLIRRSLTGDPGFIVALPRDAEADAAALERIAADALGKKLEHLQIDEVLNALRVEAGIPLVGVDADEGKLVLPETGLEQQVVSYSKGCYLGQEVIARIRTYGSVPLVLRGLIFDRAICERENADRSAEVIPRDNCGPLGSKRPQGVRLVPDCGSDLVTENGAKIGRIASREISPIFETLIAFAYLDRAHRTPGSKLKIRLKDDTFVEAEVRLLPFYRAADTASRVAFLHDRAIRLFASGDDAKAQELLEEALRLDPSFADGYEALGVLLGRTGKFTEAIDIFKRLEEVAPNEPMVHTNLSLFYMKLGDKTAAEDEKAKAVVKQFGKFAGAKKADQFAAEEAAKRKADAERKRGMFEEVLEIDAEDPVALFGLGNALSTLGDWEGAERVLAKSCAVQTDNSAAYLARGKALEMLNRESDAAKVYREGMAVASKKGDLMPLKEMERRVLLLGAAAFQPPSS